MGGVFLQPSPKPIAKEGGDDLAFENVGTAFQEVRGIPPTSEAKLFPLVLDAPLKGVDVGRKACGLDFSLQPYKKGGGVGEL